GRTDEALRHRLLRRQKGRKGHWGPSGSGASDNAGRSWHLQFLKRYHGSTFAGRFRTTGDESEAIHVRAPDRRADLRGVPKRDRAETGGPSRVAPPGSALYHAR